MFKSDKRYGHVKNARNDHHHNSFVYTQFEHVEYCRLLQDLTIFCVASVQSVMIPHHTCSYLVSYLDSTKLHQWTLTSSSFPCRGTKQKELRPCFKSMPCVIPSQCQITLMEWTNVVKGKSVSYSLPVRWGWIHSVFVLHSSWVIKACCHHELVPRTRRGNWVVEPECPGLYPTSVSVYAGP